jgi:hypothetical protein
VAVCLLLMPSHSLIKYIEEKVDEGRRRRRKWIFYESICVRWTVHRPCVRSQPSVISSCRWVIVLSWSFFIIMFVLYTCIRVKIYINYLWSTRKRWRRRRYEMKLEKINHATDRSCVYFISRYIQGYNKTEERCLIDSIYTPDPKGLI